MHCICLNKSGRRGSNSRPLAWKANALSTELLPHCTKSAKLFALLLVGRDGFEPPKVKTSRFTVCPIWPLWYLPGMIDERLEPMEGFEPPTSWLQISCSGQLSYIGVYSPIEVQSKRKNLNLPNFCTTFSHFFSKNSIFVPFATPLNHTPATSQQLSSHLQAPLRLCVVVDWVRKSVQR